MTPFSPKTACSAFWAISAALLSSCQSEVAVTDLARSNSSDSTATSDNTASTVVKRDGSGNFSAGAITATGLESGTLKVTGGTPANGKVLTSDASGNATWQTLSGTSQWTTAGSDISFSSGKVSIGTATPGQALTVAGRIETQGGLLFNQGSAATDNLIYVGSTNSGSVNASFGFMVAGMGSGSENDGPYFLGRGNSYSAGAGQRGNLYFSAGVPSAAATTEGSIYLMTSGANRIKIDPFGKTTFSAPSAGLAASDPSFDVDVGTQHANFNSNSSGAITSALHVSNNGAPQVGSGTELQFRLANSNSSYMLYGSVTSVATNVTNGTTNGDLYFSTVANNTTSEKMRITSAGDVGIGTTSPGGKLDVRPAAAGSVKVLANTGGTKLDVIHGVAQSQAAFCVGTSASCDIFEITPATIWAYQPIYINTSTSSAALITGNQGATGDLISLRKGGVSAFEIPNSGYVGISNSSPSTLLHVGSGTTTTGTTVATFQNAGGSCSVTPNTAGSISCSSDERLKERIDPVSSEYALDRLLQLQAKTYQFRSDRSGTRHTGYIAQELQKIAPEFVRKGEDGYLQVFYSGLIPWITEGIKELHSKLTGVDSRVRALEAENRALRSETIQLKAYLCAKDAQAPLCGK